MVGGIFRGGVGEEFGLIENFDGSRIYSGGVGKLGVV